METWSDIWNDILANKEIQREYRTAFLLNIFQKMCSRMNKDSVYNKHIMTLYSESFDKTSTIVLIVEKDYSFHLDAEDARLFCLWFEAHRRKDISRKVPPKSLKVELIRKQNGFCSSCGQLLGKDYSKIHVDHIIPWVLVGDELKDNYQVLCDTCNECKNSRTDFMFKNLIKLT